VALILAGLAAWAVWNFLQGVEDEALAGQELTTVFVAGGEGIAEGAEGSILVSAYDSDGQCQNEELALADVNCQIKIDRDQVEDVPDDAITTEEQLRQVLNGQVAAGPISANSILTVAQWTEVSVDIIPLSEQIPSGKQALTVSTGDVQGVNGFVEAGDRINMIITLDIEFDLIPIDSPISLPGDNVDPETGEPVAGEEEETVTVTLTRYVMQDIPVIAVGRDVRPDEDAPETVDVDEGTEGEEGAAGEEGQDQGNETTFTLEVTPEQAERIVYAFENGSIWLTLVPQDFVEVETNGVIIDNLFGGDLVESVFGDQEN
jgi:Flp pilus assembly protein CpaB